MKHWILKFFSCILSIAIFMSAIEFSPQMIAYADNILDYATSDDASQEALEEMRNAAPIKAGNWHQACIEEGNPWNFLLNRYRDLRETRLTV